MRVNSNIRLNNRRIKQLEQAQITALEMTAEALHTEIVQAQVMPFQTGNLQNEGTFVDTSQSKNGKVSIVSTTPYARRLYYHPEFAFNKSENPNAGGEWFKDWTPGGRKERFVKNAYKEFYRRISGI